MTRTYSARPMKDRLFEKLSMPSPGECWNYNGTILSNGYGQIGYGRRSQGTYKRILTHRAVWAIFIGPIPDGKQVLHKCDNRRCCNPSHLYLGTHEDNMRDMRVRGRAARQIGECHGNAKLTNAQRRDIARRHDGGESIDDLAGEFSVHPGTIKYSMKWVARHGY